MNTKDIETLAVNAVSDAFTLADFCSPYVNSNDKEPSWDGWIYIYNRKEKNNGSFAGRMPIQVKGKYQKRIPDKTQITFPVEVVQLKNYVAGKGLLYFVVYVDDANNKKIYYSDLNIVQLQLLLRETKENQKQKSIVLNELPRYNTLKSDIVLNAYKNSEKQSSFSNIKLRSLDEIMQAGQLESITTTIYGYEPINIVDALFNEKLVWYANFQNCSIPEPIGSILSTNTIASEIHETVALNGIRFYDSYNLEVYKDGFTIKIGDSFTIDATDDNHAAYHYCETDRLDAAIKDIRFFLELAHSDELILKSYKFQIGTIEKKFKDEDRVLLEHKLEFLGNAKAVFEQLGIPCYKINIHKITEKENEIIDILTKGILKKEEVIGLKQDLSPVQFPEIQGNYLLLLFEQSSSKPGTYKIFDFFNLPEYNFYKSDDKGNNHLVTPYSILKKEQFASAVNLNTDVIYHSLKRCIELSASYDFLFTDANNILLNALLAFDETGKDDLLNLAENISKMILEGCPDKIIPEEIRILNNLQIIRRKREFLDSEKDQLLDISETGEDSFKFAAHALLNQQAAAKRYFNRLPADDQKSMRELPICRFYAEE